MDEAGLESIYLRITASLQMIELKPLEGISIRPQSQPLVWMSQYPLCRVADTMTYR